MAASMFGTEEVATCVSLLVFNAAEKKCLLQLTPNSRGWWLPFICEPLSMKPFSDIATDVLEVRENGVG